jgi:hypothetical protein
MGFFVKVVLPVLAIAVIVNIITWFQAHMWVFWLLVVLAILAGLAALAAFIVIHTRWWHRKESARSYVGLMRIKQRAAQADRIDARDLLGKREEVVRLILSDLTKAGGKGLMPYAQALVIAGQELAEWDRQHAKRIKRGGLEVPVISWPGFDQSPSGNGHGPSANGHGSPGNGDVPVGNGQLHPGQINLNGVVYTITDVPNGHRPRRLVLRRPRWSVKS